MGILADFAQTRLKEITAETKVFIQGPVKYVQQRQPIRKALLLEWLDFIRPGVGTRYEHRIEEGRLKQ